MRHGLNAATGEYEDLIKAGVIDPTKVTRSGAAERGIDRGPVPHHRSCDRRQAGEDPAPAGGGMPDGGGMDF